MNPIQLPPDATIGDILYAMRSQEPSLRNVPDRAILQMIQSGARPPSVSTTALDVLKKVRPPEYDAKYRVVNATGIIPRALQHSPDPLPPPPGMLERAAIQVMGPSPLEENISSSEKMLRVVRALNRVLAAAQIPVNLGIQLTDLDAATRKDITSILGMLQTMTAAPVTMNAVLTGAKNIKDAPEGGTGDAVRDAAKSLGQEALIQSTQLIRAMNS